MSSQVINGFGCYVKYLAIKSHFSHGTYDYFTYRGRVKAKIDSYNNRRDKYYFEKLAKKLKTDDEIEAFFVANYLNAGDIWIGSLIGQDAFDVFLKWKQEIESIGYNTLQNLRGILDNKPYQKCIETNGQHPDLVILALQKKVSIEFLVIMESIVHCFDYWDSNIQDTIVWPELRDKCLKYRPFLHKYLTEKRMKSLRNDVIRLVKSYDR